jgi:tetraacyldisaccharide 4'-kinase
MRPPAFWHGRPDHPAARLLAPVGTLYGALTARRMDRTGARGPCPVICLGNFTLGGAGKTPAARTIAAMLRDLGATPAFLSRGYGGRSPGPLRVLPDRHGPGEVGDEPLLLARDGPAIVARDRPAGAALCREVGASAIVMDDGLQNPSLAKDLALAVVDAGAGIGNGRVCPAGPLRAPLSRQWRHVGGVILVGTGGPGETVAAQATAQGVPVYRARLVPEPSAIAGRRVLAFAGIGRPDKFFETVRKTGAMLVRHRAFPDHHPYRPAELAALADEARRLDAVMVTTEKDAVRLPPDFAEQVEVLGVRLEFEQPRAVRERLAGVIAGR